MRKVLVTGSAGFIGYHLVEQLLQANYDVIGLDNLNEYYDVNLKFNRLSKSGILKNEVNWDTLINSKIHTHYRFIRANLENKQVIDNLFHDEKFDFVVNLAAQAGVRYSIENPDSYIQSNLIGFYNLLEACRNFPVKHFVFASSSSVYGDSDQVPFSEDARVDSPISLYAATKKSGELMAHTYSHLFNIPTTGLRFFTVYGPWGRPDMALSLFTDRIDKGDPISVFNKGDLARDFTYIDDIVEGVKRVMESYSKLEQLKPSYQILNIGNNAPIKLMDFIRAIEKSLNKKAIINYLPMQPGDVHKTWADTSNLVAVTGFRPQKLLQEGVNDYIEWFKAYYIKDEM